MKTPRLILKTEIAKKNIQNMNSFCKEQRMDFRPHFKTHQSAEIGEWFKDEGIEKCTVSSVGMAQYFAQADWKDICIAIPFNLNEIEEVNQIASKVNLSLCVDHIDAVIAMKSLMRQLNIFIEIDSGYGRSGVYYQDIQLIDLLIQEMQKYDHLHFTGFLSHTGNSYHSLNPYKGTQLFEEARQNLVQLKQNYSEQFPDIILSMGDTPSSTFGKNFSGIDEWRPGNFVFYDFMQYALGACKEQEIAISINCPVIGIYPKRQEIAIYGGGVHLSKDSIEYQGKNIYGWLRLKDPSIEDGFPIVSLSQEHGIIKVNQSFLNKIQIGDIVEIIPIHACMTADLISEYLTDTGLRILKYRTYA